MYSRCEGDQVRYIQLRKTRVNQFHFNQFTTTWHSNRIKMENSQQTKSSKPQLIKIFQLTQKTFATIGISSEWNKNIFIGFSIVSISIICIFKFTFYEAQTFAESTQSMYMGSVAIVIILILFIFVLKAEEFYELINDCENIVNTSASKQF